MGHLSALLSGPFVGALVSLLGAVVAGSLNVVVLQKRRRMRAVEEQAKAEQTLESRMAALGEAMSDASQLMTLVQSEISARQEKIAQLAGEIEQQEQLAALSREAKDAVALVFHGELMKVNRRGIWQAFWIGAVFFLLGSGVTFLVTYYVHPAWG